jgi:hypothetical protein
MISFTRMETKEFDEEKIFNNVRDFLFDEEIEFSNVDGYEILYNLPKEVQHLVFAKIGAMLIDYSRSEDF